MAVEPQPQRGETRIAPGEARGLAENEKVRGRLRPPQSGKSFQPRPTPDDWYRMKPQEATLDHADAVRIAVGR